MSSVIHRTTFQFLESVNTPEYTDPPWLINPDVSALASVPREYWKVVGDSVLEMTQGEKDAVDATKEAARIAGLEDRVFENIIVDDPLMVTASIAAYIEDNAVWTDPLSGIKGPPDLIQCLVNRREIFGDTENPLSPDGYAGALINRASLLETIHGKAGWHQQQITKIGYQRPLDVLFFYGWPNSFNSVQNQWSNEKVAQDMAKYSMIVLGDGVQNPSHGDYANTQIIIPRIKALNPACKIFGYVTVNQTQVNFETKVDQWETLAVQGIFMDEAGYDYGKTRAEFNACVDYVHGKTNARVCFANAWNMDHIIGTANDVSYPNSTYNASLVASKLTSLDWYLLESFPINTTAYSGNAGYESKSDWAVRGIKALSHRNTFGINLAAVCIINNANASGLALFQFGFLSACMFSLEAFGTSDTSYGSSSAAVDWWTRPDISKIGNVWNLNPSVQVDVSDTDVYWRFIEFGKFMLDFSTGAQTSSITKW